MQTCLAYRANGVMTAWIQSARNAGLATPRYQQNELWKQMSTEDQHHDTAAGNRQQTCIPTMYELFRVH